MVTSMGKSTITDSQLNISWTVAAAKARLNSFRSVACINETIVLVTEVPIFAPITIGIAWRTLITKSSVIIREAFASQSKSTYNRNQPLSPLSMLKLMSSEQELSRVHLSSVRPLDFALVHCLIWFLQQLDCQLIERQSSKSPANIWRSRGIRKLQLFSLYWSLLFLIFRFHLVLWKNTKIGVRMWCWPHLIIIVIWKKAIDSKLVLINYFYVILWLSHFAIVKLFFINV